MSDQVPPGALPPDSPTIVGDSGATPTTLAGKYRVVRVIGEGSFGRVYLATDPLVRRNVAVKELLSSRQTDRDIYARALERFQREARAAGVTQHPNIVSVYELAVDNTNNYYLVMEYVDGTDLRALLAQVGTLPPDRAIAISLDIARALEEIHAQDIVHRDLKPANIMLTRRGVAKLTDFGVAQVGSESQRTTVMTGHPGTPMYMSPEQSTSTGYLDGRSDLYSLGLVMYEMLVGTPYMRSRRALETVRPDLPQPLIAIVNRLSQRNPDDRYPSATEVIADLEALSGRRPSIDPIALPGPTGAETRVAGPGSQGGQGMGSMYPPIGVSPYGPPPQTGNAPPPQYQGYVPPGQGNLPPQFGGFPPQGPGSTAPYQTPGGPPPYTPPPAAPPPSNTPRRGPIFAIAGVLVALLVIIGGLALARGGGDKTSTATPAIATGVSTGNAGAATPTMAGAAMNTVSVATNTAPAPAMNTAGPATPAMTTRAPTATNAPAPNPSPAPPRPTAMPSVTLTTWSDPDGRLKLQFPSNWTVSRDTQDSDNVVQLGSPDGATFNVYVYQPSSSLEQDFADFRGQDLKCADITSMCGTVMDVKVGGEPAKYADGSEASTNGGHVPYAYWLTDHNGARYEFELYNYGTHRMDGQAIVDSVVFTMSATATNTVPPKPTPAPLTAWTDPTGTVKFQHPTAWKESRDTSGNSDDAVNLQGSNVQIFVNITASPVGTLDDDLATYRKQVMTSSSSNYTLDAPKDAKVGGEPARAMTFSFISKTAKAGDKPSLGVMYVVDHKGKRYEFICADLSLHRAEIEAMIASVTFLK